MAVENPGSEELRKPAEGVRELLDHLQVRPMQIRRSSTGYVADYWFGEIPLPTLRALKLAAIDRLHDGDTPEEQHAAGLLGECDLGYDVAQGKDVLEQLIVVVIKAPDSVYDLLGDPKQPYLGIVVDALLEACPNIGEERVERR